MNGASNDVQGSLKALNADGLYSREQIVDPEAGEITILRPVTVGGVRDTTRSIRYFSTILIAIAGRQQPLGFELEVSSIEEAVAQWPEKARAAAEKAQEDLKSRQIRANLAGPVGMRAPLNS